MAPAPALSRELMQQGTTLVQQALGTLADTDFTEPSTLPDWSRAHVTAHLAANADALLNLVSWARTGVETPMYSSPLERAEGIERGARRTAPELRAWFAESATLLAEGLDALTPEQWSREIRTAQGRTVPATEVPWMRTREVMIHAVDLGAGVRFEDLPTEFLVAILDDATAKRSAAADGPALLLEPIDDRADGRVWSVAGTGAETRVRGPLAELAAYVTGRAPHAVAAEGADLPDLPPWL